MCNRSERPAERVRLDVEGEPPPAVDLDHGQPLPVLGLERGIARDVHLAQLEAELVPQGAHLSERFLAQVATVRMEDGDSRGVRDRCPA